MFLFFYQIKGIGTLIYLKVLYVSKFLFFLIMIVIDEKKTFSICSVKKTFVFLQILSRVRADVILL